MIRRNVRSNEMKKRVLGLGLAMIMLTGVFTGCTKTPTDLNGDGATTGFDATHAITVVSREDGSGTRGAFIELTGVLGKDANDKKVDNTTLEAIIAGKTDIMMTNVGSDEYAIGYVSTGSLNDTIKALQVDGIVPTSENIKSGTYKLARNFNIATKGEVSAITKNFIDFILSAQGQEVIGKSYIKIDDAAADFTGASGEGKVVVVGSSSVTPIMEKLKEAYEVLNAGANIEIQQSDSSAGMKAAMDGTCDIGMASRELKDSEKAEITGMPIAIDGIAVIVNPKNTKEDLTIDEIKNIFTGVTLNWDGK